MAETIGRSFDTLNDRIKSFNKELKTSTQETRALDRAIRLDPSNVELVTQKYESLGNQLNLTRQKSEALAQQKTALAQDLESGVIKTTAEYEKELEKIEKQAKLTGIQLKGLEGAVKQKDAAISRAKVGVGGMTKSLMDASRAATNMTIMMGGMTQATAMFGMTSEHSGNQTARSMQTAMRGVQAFTSILPMLQVSMSTTASKFQKATVAATMFGGALMMGINLAANWNEMSTIERILGTLTTAFFIAATAVTVFKAALTLGKGVPKIIAGIAAGTAAVAAAGAAVGVGIGSSRSAARSASVPSVADYGASYADTVGGNNYYNNTSTGNVTFNVYNPANYEDFVQEVNNRFLQGRLLQG